MILLLALLFLFRQYGTSAAPVTSSFVEPSAYNATLFVRDNCPDASPGRSVWDIVWSCLATTFAVTWVSVHPNVPWLEESSWHLLKRRIFLMCLALLAPEVMIMWAFKQWRGALMIKEAFNKARSNSCRPWTMAHAHFLQMGGFKLRTLNQVDNIMWNECDYRTKGKENEEEWEGVFMFCDLKNLLVDGKITCPDITEEEIEDRSKSDALSKGVALLQISWFLLQLIARAHQHLDITEIELTTAALAGLNSIMYLFWWNKPFDVRCPIVIRTKELERRLAGAAREDVGRTDGNDGQGKEENIDVGETKMETGETSASVLAGGTAEQTKWWFPVDDFDLTSHLVERVRSTIRTIFGQASGTQEEQTLSPIPAAPASNKNTEKSAFRLTPKSIWTCCKSAATMLLYVPYLLMFMPVEAILRPGWLHDLRSFSDAKDKMDNAPSLQLLFNKNDMRWIMSMMFYSEKAEKRPLLIFSALSGAAFGSIHCAAWKFDFPSLVEKVLWRTASLTVVGVCLSIIVGIPLYNAVERRRDSAGKKAFDRYDNDQKLPISEQQGVKHYEEDAKFRVWTFIERSLEIIPAIIYPLARLSLLALALSSLRDLRGSTLETVTWTKFIPHI